MKFCNLTNVFLILLCSIIIIPHEGFADASNTIRSGCSLFNKRYKSSSHTKGNDFWDWFGCNDNDSDCNSTWTSCFSYDDGGAPNWCAYATASVSGPGLEQEFTDVNSGCTAGLGISDLSSFLMDGYKDAGSSTSTKFEYYRNIDVENKLYSIYSRFADFKTEKTKLYSEKF